MMLSLFVINHLYYVQMTTWTIQSMEFSRPEYWSDFHFHFHYVQMYPSMSSMVRVFEMNEYWILPNAFTASVEMIMWFLSFLSLMWCTTLTNLQILNHTCTPGISPSWSWYMMVSMWCWIWFSNIYLRILASIFNRNIGIYFSFLVVSLSGLVLG